MFYIYRCKENENQMVIRKTWKTGIQRNISERKKDYVVFEEEFGHLEGDTIVGIHHKSAVITLVERLSKAIIALKPEGRKAVDIENSINEWLQSVPKNLFKSITFDCGKEFSNWKSISNTNDIDIYFADPGTPSQRGLNEHSNGLLRKDGLPKKWTSTKSIKDSSHPLRPKETISLENH